MRKWQKKLTFEHSGEQGMGKGWYTGLYQAVCNQRGGKPRSVTPWTDSCYTEGTQSCTAKQCITTETHCYGWGVAVGPFSATAVPLRLTQCAVPFVQIVTTVCLQGTWFYTILHDMSNAWYMILRHWVDLIHCSLNQSECLPILPFDWGKLVYSVANQNPGLVRHAVSK